MGKIIRFVAVIIYIVAASILMTCLALGLDSVMGQIPGFKVLDVSTIIVMVLMIPASWGLFVLDEKLDL